MTSVSNSSTRTARCRTTTGPATPDQNIRLTLEKPDAMRTTRKTHYGPVQQAERYAPRKTIYIALYDWRRDPWLWVRSQRSRGTSRPSARAPFMVRRMDNHHLVGFGDDALDSAEYSGDLRSVTDPDLACSELSPVSQKPGCSLTLYECNRDNPGKAPKDIRESRRQINKYAAMAAMPPNACFNNGVLQGVLEASGFENGSVNDLTANVLPIMRWNLTVTRLVLRLNADGGSGSLKSMDAALGITKELANSAVDNLENKVRVQNLTHENGFTNRIIHEDPLAEFLLEVSNSTPASASAVAEETQRKQKRKALGDPEKFSKEKGLATKLEGVFYQWKVQTEATLYLCAHVLDSEGRRV
ncbi:uncharacterized protein BP5553_05915 [Venustampulla echinocandica]|uniref:Uncharacterized protein n=1 Tax=Venustampulla echinocandica TaxID=2656787 RepID=A0A370TM13_9HELO|nr:uncharacterized protein BP5553_05915 [Venustampulla echinocandica]RDL36563.1 hypothetical protein BP5553_05915 [Venustampulla echinocandica]